MIKERETALRFFDRWVERSKQQPQILIPEIKRQNKSCFVKTVAGGGEQEELTIQASSGYQIIYLVHSATSAE